MAKEIQIGKVMVTWQGEYDSSKSYTRLDAVMYQGSSYVCLADTSSTPPSDSWQLLAGKGDKGDTGATGPAGKDGQTPDVSNLATKTDLANYYTKPETDSAINSSIGKAQIGGRNLLRGTATFEFPFVNNEGTQTIQKYDDETNYIQYTSNTPIDSIGPYWEQPTPKVGQVYTLSADVCGNGHITGYYFHYEGGDAGSLGQVDLTNDWQRISNTFRVNTASGAWVIYADNSTLLKIKDIKIEKGNVATDWTPAPEDTITAIQNNTTAIGHANQQITDLQTAVKAQQSAAQEAQSTAETAQSKAEQAITLANDAKPNIDSSSQTTSKKPSDYSEGIYHEVKDVSVIGIVRTPADFAPEGRQGTTAFVTTMSYGGMAHQTADIVDSEKPMRFCRNGKGDTWYHWEWTTTD